MSVVAREDDDPYYVLGVTTDASDDDIKAAYRAAAKKAHPDAGGSHEEMSRLTRAMAILGDPASRARYDRTGEDGPGDNDALSIACGVFVDAITQLIRLGHDPGKTDVLDLVRKALQKDVTTREPPPVTYAAGPSAPAAPPPG